MSGCPYNSAVQRPLEQRLNAIGLIVGPAAALVVVLVMAGRSGPGSPHMGIEALATLFGSLPLLLAWMVAAAGLGWPLRSWLAPGTNEPAALQVALGIAAMLFLNSALGRVGVLQLGGSLGAWLLIIAGWVLLLEQIRRRGFEHDLDVVSCAPHWLIWTAAPTIGVMLLAATSATGWLWDTEYGGYDALSYHLQLPREWLAAGAIAPLEHNVYSFLPGAMEATFYQLMVLRGDAVAAVYACQLLHAGIGIVAAWVVGRVVVRVLQDGGGAQPQAAWAGAVAFVMVVGTPWVVVAGTLAYNEMAVLLMLAAGMLVIAEDGERKVRRAFMIGLFAGVACAAKLTAIGFVAAPLGVLLLICVPPRQWSRAVPAAIVAGAIALSPYLISNSIASGNPVFPFATNVFGTGHWTVEQVMIWRDGHQSDLALGGRLAEGWHQFLRFGIGTPPPHEERWHAQWSVLPWLTIAALIVVMTGRSMRRWGILLLIMIAIQIVFWLGFTHIKSRFMLPVVVPGGVALGIALAVAISLFPRRWESSGRTPGIWSCTVVGVAALIWSIVPVYIFARQVGGMPAAAIGLANIMTGKALSPRDRVAASADSPVIYMNQLLPEGSRVLFVGEAAPFYYDASYTYNTVWDRGPMSRVMRENPIDPAAWFGALRRSGYTHVLFDWVMLARWEEAGWNDPLLAIDRLTAATAVLDLERRWEGRAALYRIP